jgi:hypothetical protein
MVDELASFFPEFVGRVVAFAACPEVSRLLALVQVITKA